MKKRYINISLILTSIALTCSSCDSFSNETISGSFLACFTPFQVAIQNTNDGKHIDNIKDIALKVDYLCNTNLKKGSPGINGSYASSNNVEYINSHSGEFVEVDPWLCEILKESVNYCTLADNKISIFLGKTKAIWTDLQERHYEHVDETQVIDENILRELKESVEEAKQTKLVFEGNKVKKVGDANIDLGAFAKGFILNKIKDYLDANKMKNYIVNGGNSAILLGEKAGGETFKVSMSNFPNKYINAKNCAISVSSMTEQAFTIGGVRYSHLINVEDGIANCPTPYVFLMGDNPFKLDAFSTAACFFKDDKNLKDFLSKNKLEYIVSKDEKTISYHSKDLKILTL